MASWEEFSRIVAEAKAAKKLDPVGHEDDDVDNDGDSDSSDSYLKKRRAAVGAAIASDKVRKEEVELDETSYSAKAARAGEDIGKPGKQFAKIAKSAAERYGSKERGEKVAGAVLAKLRKEALDPVGQEDKDIDNDGDHDKSDKYLLNRRKVRAKVIPPQERLKTDRNMFSIPKSEQEAARERTLAKAKAKRMKEEVEQIDEIAPILAGAALVGGTIAAGKALGGAMNKFVDKHSKTKSSDYSQKQGLGANLAKQRERLQQNSYQPEGEMVEEDKEYRREMRKAAARERAEEKSGRKEEGKRSAKAPGRLGKSAGTSYADKEQLSIKGHDEVTKKAGHTVGNPFPEHVELTYEAKKSDYLNDKLPSDEKLGYGFSDNKKRVKDLKKLKRLVKHYDGMKKGDPMYNSYEPEGEMVDESALGTMAVLGGMAAGRALHGAMEKRKSRKEYEEKKRTSDGLKLKSRAKRSTDGGWRNRNEEVETIEEKALSRAQQRFMGMVYAAKKGETPASPEVAKAASGMSKKAARDFAKTKHEGLPEKKEETKEELSLVDRIIEEVLNEAPKGTIPGGKSKSKKYKAVAKQAKLAAAVNQVMKGDSEPESEPAPKKSEEERKETAKKQVKRGKSDPSALTRRAAVAGAAKLKAEKEKTKRQRERQKYETQKRKEKSLEKRAEKEKESKEKQQKLEASMKEKRIKSAQSESDREEARKEKTRKDIKSAYKQGIGSIKTGYVSDKESDLKSAGQALSNVGAIASGVLKTGKGIVSAKLKERGEKKKEEKRAERHEKIRQEMNKEQFSNWREEFIFEVDDQSIKEPQQKVIDVSKKKNKIEINPNMSEENIQEIAPLVGILARVAGGAATRGIAARGAGFAARGALEKKAVDIAAQKGGEVTADMVQKRLEKKFKNEDEELEEGMTMDDFKKQRRRQKEEPPIRKRGGISAPEDERSIGGEANRKNKDYWASVVGKNRDRGAGNKAKRRASELNKEEFEIEEGMTLKDFKKKRSAQKQKEKRAAEKTSPLRRAGIHDDKASPERDARHRANVDPDFDGDDSVNYPGGKLKNPKKIRKAKALGELGESAAWTKKEGKSEAGGLNEKGRKSYERENPGSDLKAPSKKVGNPRRASFCARMSGMKAKLTSKKTANDPDSRINKSLRAWNC